MLLASPWHACKLHDRRKMKEWRGQKRKKEEKGINHKSKCLSVCKTGHNTKRTARDLLSSSRESKTAGEKAKSQSVKSRHITPVRMPLAVGSAARV